MAQIPKCPFLKVVGKGISNKNLDYFLRKYNKVCPGLSKCKGISQMRTLAKFHMDKSTKLIGNEFNVAKSISKVVERSRKPFNQYTNLVCPINRYQPTKIENNKQYKKIDIHLKKLKLKFDN